MNICSNQVDIAAKEIRAGENKSCQMEGVENGMEEEQVWNLISISGKLRENYKPVEFDKTAIDK